MKISVFAAAILSLAGSALANPIGDNVGAQVEKRATRSSQGWYSYGCYEDCYDGMNRFLPTRAYKDADNNPNKCIAACIAQGFNYAGLQFQDECWCGSKLAGPPTKPTDCFMKCEDGNKCGGPCRNNIWSAFRKPGH